MCWKLLARQIEHCYYYLCLSKISCRRWNDTKNGSYLSSRLNSVKSISSSCKQQIKQTPLNLPSNVANLTSGRPIAAAAQFNLQGWRNWSLCTHSYWYLMNRSACKRWVIEKRRAYLAGGEDSSMAKGLQIDEMNGSLSLHSCIRLYLRICICMCKCVQVLFELTC